MMAFIVLADVYDKAFSRVEGFAEVQNSFDASLIIMLVLFASMSVMGIAFGSAAKKRGYKNGISTSGVVLGVLGLVFYLISAIVGIAIM